jgi:hypothetical protein
MTAGVLSGGDTKVLGRCWAGGGRVLMGFQGLLRGC